MQNVGKGMARKEEEHRRCTSYVNKKGVALGETKIRRIWQTIQ
jgi:hypothetical protein